MSVASPLTGRVDAESSVLPLIAAFFLSLWLAYIPTNVFTGNLDNSWRATLTYAHHHGLQWGSDIVFTYGPLGFLFVHDSDASDARRRMWTAWLSCLFISAGACLLAWRMNALWRILFLAFLVLSPFASVSKELGLSLGLVFWTFLTLDTQGRPALLFAAVSTLGAAVLALVKFTFLVEGIVMLVALVLDRVLRKDKRSAAILAMVFCGVYLAGWITLGQRVSGLIPHLRNWLELAAGYDLAMCSPGPREVRVGGILVAILFVATAVLRERAMLSREPFWSASRRAVLLGWLMALTFLGWKHGYVRADTHIIMFLGFTSIVGLAFEALADTSSTPAGTRTGIKSQSLSPSIGRLQTAARLGSVTICLLACSTLHWTAPTMFEGRLEQAFNRISNNLRALLSPSWYQREIAKAHAGALQRYELPKLRRLITTNVVDIFGQNQLYAMLNDLRFQPRPVFQSYCAYTPYLASLNERFFAGASAPEFVLFDLAPLDDRLPSLEDSKVFRRLLTQYQLIDSEATFLLLRRTPEEAPPLVLQHQGTARFGERIKLTVPGGSDLVMQIDLSASVWGKLRQFFYQPPKVYLLCQTNLAGEGLTFAAPTPMLAAGFVISPLFRNRTDVQEYFEGKTLLVPVSVSVELARRDEMFYRQPFRYSIFRFRRNQ